MSFTLNEFDVLIMAGTNFQKIYQHKVYKAETGRKKFKF